MEGFIMNVTFDMDEIFTNLTYELEPIDGGPRLRVEELVAVVLYI